MPIYANAICKYEGEKETIEPITVTITLEEYRSLIEDVTRLRFENQSLCEHISKMEEKYRSDTK
jgi:hypothetical protein